MYKSEKYLYKLYKLQNLQNLQIGRGIEQKNETLNKPLNPLMEQMKQNHIKTLTSIAHKLKKFLILYKNENENLTEDKIISKNKYIQLLEKLIINIEDYLNNYENKEKYKEIKNCVKEINNLFKTEFKFLPTQIYYLDNNKETKYENINGILSSI